MGGEEDQLEGVYDKLHSLNDFIDPKNYKSYDELKAKMNKVLGIDAGAPAMEMPAMNVVESNPIGATADMAPVSTPAASDAEEDTLSYFAKLAQEN